MSNILVLYATSEGQTAKIARAIGDTLAANNMGVDVVEAGAAAPDPRHYDGVVVAASVHGGHFQQSVNQWGRSAR